MLTPEQIQEVKGLYHSWQEENSCYEDVPELCASVLIDDADGLIDNGYSLAPSKYIEFVDRDLGIDYEKEMTRIQNEMRDLMKMEKESQVMLEAAFEGIGHGIS